MTTVTLTPAAVEQLDAINNPIHGRIVKLLIRMADWPNVSGAKPLTGELAGRYRLRTGDYRVQFYLDGENAIVEKIGHRDKFYNE